MSNDSERRIAELEEELRRLKAQVARPPDPPASPYGTADVSGSLQGNAIGISYGILRYPAARRCQGIAR
jgi:hypothetical protein